MKAKTTTAICDFDNAKDDINDVCFYCCFFFIHKIYVLKIFEQRYPFDDRLTANSKICKSKYTIYIETDIFNLLLLLIRNDIEFDSHVQQFFFEFDKTKKLNN